MPSENKCLTCSAELTGKRTKFCCQKCAAHWHNHQIPWRERKSRQQSNATKKAAYHADPEFWRNKARKWREDHPEQTAFFAQRQKEKYWESPWRKLVIAAKGRAKKKNVPFDLTFEWAEQKWTGFCEVTKLPFAPRYGAPIGSFSPTVDRIIPKLGYTQGNCRFVLAAVNFLKGDGNDEAMLFIAKAIIENLGICSKSRTLESIAEEAG